MNPFKDCIGITGVSESASSTIDADLAGMTYERAVPFIPSFDYAKVVKVYDGDTVTVAARILLDGRKSSTTYRFQIRLRGIDTPEIKTKNAREKELATKARDALSKYILGKIINVSNIAYDKYGRILADITAEDGQNISEWMVANNYAVRYDGGTKTIPDEWINDA